MGDYMLLSELASKDVVNLTDGNKIGRIKDLEIDLKDGNIVSISVMTVSRLRSFFQGESLIVIPWQKIVKLGGEVIIVKTNE